MLVRDLAPSLARPQRAVAGVITGVVAGLLAMAAFSTPAMAQEISIQLDQSKADQLGLNAAALEADLNQQMGGQLKLGSQQEFLSQMGAANIMAAKGMGADYASNPQRFVLGGGFGTAVSAAGARFGRGAEGLPAGGFAFQASLLAGVNLGILSGNDSFLRRFMLYANGLLAETNPDPFHASATNLGAHLQFKLVRPKDHSGLFEWGGLDVTSGYEYSNYRLSLSQEFPIQADSLTWNATGNLGIGTDSTSIPIELSTNLRVFILSAYLGAAVDVSPTALSTSEISLGGPVVVDYSGATENIGTASVSLTDQGGASGTTGRLFGGAQVNILFVKVYAHLNVGLDQSFGGHLGLRLAM
ncbi:MAG: hypothetical protein GXP62_22170 [Oligoflexia bacterium]|nr:hypothetical protein [Oligoflexia bacterium]